MATYTVSAANLLDAQRLKIEVLNRGDASFKHDLQEITEGVQADRAAALLQSRSLQLSAQLLLQAESARIASIAPDDLRVFAFAQAAQGALERAGLLDDEATLASVRVPRVKKTEALLHGRITDELDRAAGPVTVTLVDAQGAAVTGVAPVEADSAGYYALVVPAEVAAKLPADSRFSVVVGHGDERTPSKTEPVPLTAGVVEFKAVRLTDKELLQLKLRDGSFSPETPTPVTPVTPARPVRAAAPRKRPPKG